MKVHARKKAYRRMLHEMAAKGFINLPDGTMSQKGDSSRVKDNSMVRDYYPQRGV